MSTTIKKIYVDMDGVLCNFERRYRDRFGDITEHDRKTVFKPNFAKFIESAQFATLDLMDDALELIKGLNDIDIPKEILSSTAYEHTFDAIAFQKGIWLEEHGITWTRNFVPGKRHKYKWATLDSIIIDDTLSVIEDWERAGGIAIHHRSAATTLAELSLLTMKPLTDLKLA
jgi:hypothetical protein